MTRFFIPLLFLAALWAPGTAHAEVFNDAQVMEPGEFRLGLEPQVNFGPGGPAPFIGYLRFGFGIGAGADLQLVGGFFRPDTYVGADIEFSLLPDGSGYPALSLTTGLHFWYNSGRVNQGYPGLDGALLLSETIGQVSLYGGVDSNLEILPNQFQFPTRAVVGVDVSMNRVLHLLFEAGINLHASPHHISGGIALFF